MKAKKFLKNMKAVESKKVAGWKQKISENMKTVESCWKIFKPAVESKKVAEKSENGWKQKSCWKIFKPAVEG